MTRAPLNEISYRAVKVVEARAQRDGTDVWEELNKVGLLATAPRIREIEVAALKNMFDRLQDLRAGDLLEHYRQGNSNPATPSDLYEVVLRWMRTYIERVEV